jgi:hypothetical protein
MRISRTPLLIAFAILYLGPVAYCADKTMDTAAIERLTGAKGTLDEKEGVFKVSVPRKDLSVIVAGVKMSPPMGLTSWAAFKRASKDDMVMGDMVMTEDQVSPVMSAALNNGLEVTALHNHFIWDSPRIMFMHIGGMGPEKELATAVGGVFAAIHETAGTTGASHLQAISRKDSEPRSTPRTTRELPLNGCADGARRKRAGAHASSRHARADANAAPPLNFRAGADGARRERADAHERWPRARGNDYVSPGLNSPLR